MEESELSVVEQDAFALIEHAVNISRSMADFNYSNLISALDSNLQLWVGIKTVADNNPHLSSDTKDMLNKLSKFVAKKTFEFGDMSEEKAKNSSVDFFINTNLQICEGLLECVASGHAEDEAYTLIMSANAMVKALDAQNPDMMNQSLDNNLKMWVAIKTLVKSKDSVIPTAVKNNLLKLADYVVAKTFEISRSFSEVAVSSLINTNIQIAKGLLESAEDDNRKDALALLKSAVALDEARAGNDNSAMSSALDSNLELWVKIRTLMENKNQHLGKDVKENLITLSKSVTAMTFEYSKNADPKKIDTLININLQICEGLLEKKTIFN